MTHTLRTSFFAMMACFLWASAPVLAEEEDFEFTQSFSEGDSYLQEFGVNIEFSIELPQIPGGKFSFSLTDTERQEVSVGALAEVDEDEENQQLPRHFRTHDLGSSFVVQLNDNAPFVREKLGGKDGQWIIDDYFDVTTRNGDDWMDAFPQDPAETLLAAIMMGRIGNMDLDAYAGCDCEDPNCDSDCDDSDCACDCSCQDSPQQPPFNFEPLLEWAASVTRVASRPLMLQAATGWEMLEDVGDDLEDLQEDLAAEGLPVVLNADYERNEQMLGGRISATANGLPVAPEMVAEVIEQGLIILDELFGVELTDEQFELLDSAIGVADLQAHAGGAWASEKGLYYSLAIDGSATVNILVEGQPAGKLVLKLGTHAISVPADLDPAERLDLGAWVN